MTKDEEKTREAGGVISLLEKLQEKKGYLDAKDLEKTSKKLKVPLAELYGVATFYSQFRLRKRAKHIIRVCAGTSCHLKGAPSVLEELKKELGIKEGESTPDGKFSLELVNCVGACALAPVVRVDDDDHARVTPKKLKEILKRYK